ncbi:Kinase family protein [Thalictrum thalictroides]|uniref:non-specific serine/threonine protein kinase n=1 Tax=Thalictrum thalictroides TaxID=46969 RepID=A0A7J6X7Q8_THATH|nr:Kinase family protein [Thalictrum thalictroides]
MIMKEDFRDSCLCNLNCFGSIIDKSPQGKFCRIRDKKLIALFCISVSGQDFSAVEMEKDRVGESSPRGVLDNCSRSLESETSSSKASTSDSESPPIRNASHWRSFFSMLKSRSIRRLASFPPSAPKLSRRISRSMRENPASSLIPAEDTNIYSFKSSWKNFTFAELQAATKNFSSDNLIGKGGYAEVYKGCLQDGQYVAIKRLTRGTSEERTGDFLTELGIIVHVNHHNTAKLIGYGIEGGMHLVLELSPHGCLASLLYGSNEKLDWGIRYKIALGTAEGLLYLHEGCPRRIIHRDIKSSNILLTQEFEPQICDFGLAKWLPELWTHHTVSKFEGTFGYLAPEYLVHGIVDEKTDVFAFGVLLLELITGRQALDNTQQSLVIWAKPFLNKNKIRELIDPSIGDAYDSRQMNHVVLTASLCIHQSSILRPKMSQVIKLLRGDETSLECVQQFQRSFLQKTTFSEDLFDSEDHNSTRYLNDLTRHKKIAFEI